jgi:hypothetical protein
MVEGVGNASLLALDNSSNKNHSLHISYRENVPSTIGGPFVEGVRGNLSQP